MVSCERTVVSVVVSTLGSAGIEIEIWQRDDWSRSPVKFYGTKIQLISVPRLCSRACRALNEDGEKTITSSQAHKETAFFFYPCH